MPSAANGKSEKPASSEALDNTPIRQVMTIIEHKIRNLEKRKGKLTQYRDLQKAGKTLDKEQKVAVAKYDEVNQTLEFAREFSKLITQIATSAERDAKKQAKKDAWVRYAADANKIREVLLVLDALNVMGSEEVRVDFLNGANGAAKLTLEDLRILDDLYSEVTPKHEPNEEGQPGFHAQSARAAEHLCSITEGKAKEVIGTTYTHIKEIITSVHECGYFDKVPEPPQPEPIPEPEPEPIQELEPEVVEVINEQPSVPAGFAPLPIPPAPAVVPTPAYPLRPLPPITLQEVEHAYFAHQYPQQRPISEVIGSQNFFFLQESELDSPNGTPQPMQPSPQGIPTQTFTNQHFIPGQMHEQMPHPQFAPMPEHGFPHPMAHMAHMPHPQMVNHMSPPLNYVPAPVEQPLPVSPAHAPVPQAPEIPADEKVDEWKETSPERDDNGERRTQGQGDGQGRFRRYGGRGSRGAPNGHGRGRGSFRQGDGYRGRNSEGYQNRSDYQGRDGYQGRQNKDRNYDNKDRNYDNKDRNYDNKERNYDNKDRNYDNKDRNYDNKERNYDNKERNYDNRDRNYDNKDRNYDNKDRYDSYQRNRDSYQNRNNDDGYYGNGDTGDGHRDRTRDENGRDTHFRDGFKGRGRGSRPNRPPRTNNYRKEE